MNVINKSFQDNKTGEVFMVIDSYQNIAVTDKKERIRIDRLTDTRYYTEYIDPNTFLNSPSTYGLFTETIKSVDLSKIPEDEIDAAPHPGSFKIESQNSPLMPSTNESAVIYADPEDEIEELKRKYGATTFDSNALNKQNEAFSKILEDDVNDTTPQNIQPHIENAHKEHRQSYVVEVEESTMYNPPIQRFEVEDPIITMFKGVKRSVNFSSNLKIEGKIPRLDFIEMMEDSYEISIIEYLAEEFTKNIIQNPEEIKRKIVNEIKSLISNNKKRSKKSTTSDGKSED